MPTYHYACSSCAHEFDQYQPFTADPLTDCPSCDGRIRRVIQPVGVVFKGSGWYLTDSRKPESTDASAKDTSADAGAPDKAASADAAKPDGAKKDAKPKAEPAAKKSVESKPTAAAAT